MSVENIARRARPTRSSQRPPQPWVGTAGWALVCAALSLAGYVVVAVTLGVVSLVALFATGFEIPVAPIVIVPGALILGIALLRSNRPPRPAQS
jgi:hypothetical protein